ncbi:competence protein ComA [Avibacterium sp. 21-599]|uniref:competence protein ComA n=1 Tax=Avibacterium sp. 21-599 TaxID=2911528 RepID=UPI002248626D|nr:competence protein ComA [Avibacterium sp. 21-599]MCW9719033.1 competence protein ComA [Avibacterium sp. 21-599]
MRKITHCAAQKQQVGVWKKGENYQCVWFDETNQVQCCTLSSPISLPQLARHMPSSSRHSLKTMRFITAISPQYTWIQTLLLPQILTAAECEQQCRFLFSQALPLPIEEIWFDYQLETLKQGVKLSIVAIKKQTALDYLNAYAPLPIQVLDCCIHAIIRAFHYLTGIGTESQVLFLYQDEQYTFAIQPNAPAMQFMQHIDKNLPALAEMFCQRYSFQPEQIYVYCGDVQAQPLPSQWQTVETHLPFIALGNALWQQEGAGNGD